MRTAPNHPITFGNALVCILVLALPALTRGQLRNANWLWCSYWLSFASGVPVNLPPSPYFCPAASLSDTAGNLLLYFIDGNGSPSSTVGVRSADHQLIAGNPSFDGTFGESVTPGAIFIPKPGDVDRAYLIAWNRIPGVEAKRFGVLEVFVGNATDPPQVLSSEYAWFMTGASRKRMVIPHDNGMDYWFVAQMEGTNEYHAYQVTSAGLSSTPVVSTAGAVMPPDFNWGKLIPTVDGTRFVSVSETLGFTEPTVAPSITEVLSFDPAAGVIQHQLTLDAPARMDGVEFSPSGRFLYVMRWFYANPVITHELYQYDLEAADPNLSPFLMDNYVVSGLSGISTNILSHAPNGRIYVSHYVPSMGVINEPDLPCPQCDYAHDDFLASTGPRMLPSFIKRYNDPPPLGPMGVRDPTSNRLAIVQPNPLAGAGELRLSGATGPVSLEWLDVQGRVVRKSTPSAIADRMPVDATGLADGHYLLRAQVGEKAPVVVRVSVER